MPDGRRVVWPGRRALVDEGAGFIASLDRERLWYLSIDVDVLDPSVMPDTGTPVPGGWFTHELIGLIPQAGGRGDDVVVLITGEVFEEFRGNGWGARLVRWCVDRARGRAGAIDSTTDSTTLRLVCEHRDATGGLNRVLARIGFDSVEFNEVTREIGGLAAESARPGGVSLAPMGAGLLSWIE